MKEKYESPSVDVVEVEVEKGFAISGESSGSSIPDYEDGGLGW